MNPDAVIFRVVETSQLRLPGQLVVRYFRDRGHALDHASELARQYSTVFAQRLTMTPLNRNGLIAVWRDHDIDPHYEVRVEEGQLED